MINRQDGTKYLFESLDSFLKKHIINEGLDDIYTKYYAEAIPEREVFNRIIAIDPTFKESATPEAMKSLRATIAMNVEKGTYTGSVPCNWEVVIDKDAIDLLLAKDDEYVSNEEANKVLQLPSK